jgi:hypothetical protein
VTCSTWPIFRPNERSIGRKVDFATRWQVRGGHVPILVHWRVNRHTVDKSGGLSVIIPKLFCVRCLVFCVRTWCRTCTFWNLCPLSCPDMWENINLLPIVSEHSLRMSGHLAEEKLYVTCVRTRLLAVWTLCRKSWFLETNNYVEYFSNHNSFLFLNNIMQYSPYSTLSFLD